MIALEHCDPDMDEELFKLIVIKHLEFKDNEAFEIATTMCKLALKSHTGSVSLPVMYIERFRYVAIHMQRCYYQNLPIFKEIIQKFANRLNGFDIMKEHKNIVYVEHDMSGKWYLTIK